MDKHLFHIFRNTPFGRETLMQSVYFCQRYQNIFLHVYIPKHTQFLMYFENNIVTVDLDPSYIFSPETAREHADEILQASGVNYSFFEPKDFTASTLPNLPTDMDFMCCPRSISDMSTKIGLGYIGSRVRAIAHQAEFPVYIPTPVFKEWKTITAFFGGSEMGARAVCVALNIGKETGFPVKVFTQCEGMPKTQYEDLLKETGALDQMKKDDAEWIVFEKDDMKTNLYAVPHDSLVVHGIVGKNILIKLVFGSKAEQIQTVLPNPLLIMGANCHVK